MLVERRVFLVDAELRAASDGKTITGYAARYNTLSQPLPAGNGHTFRERISPGAFKRAVESGQDVTCLVQHDGSKLLGRTASGTLQLRDTPTGLAFKCSMPDTQLGHDTHEMIKRGDLNACSFGFMLGDRSDDSWEEEDVEDEEDFESEDNKKQKRSRSRKTTRQAVRTIHNVRHLYDVSVVTRAAYPNGTCVQARESRSLIRKSPPRFDRQSAPLNPPRKGLCASSVPRKFLMQRSGKAPSSRRCEVAEGIF